MGLHTCIQINVFDAHLNAMNANQMNIRGVAIK